MKKNIKKWLFRIALVICCFMMVLAVYSIAKTIIRTKQANDLYKIRYEMIEQERKAIRSYREQYGEII